MSAVTGPAVLSSRTAGPSAARPTAPTGETFGEAVFSTGMTGYQETLTDPSYHRQVVVMTAPHVGNTGVNDEDPESRADLGRRVRRARPGPRCRRSWRVAPHASTTSCATQGVVGISGVDTRALTRHLRERGAMRVGISTTETDPERAAGAGAGVRARWPAPTWPARSSTDEAYVVPAVGEKRFTVAALDLGIKAMTPRRMAERGIEVHVLPATVDARRRARRRSPTGCSSPTARATRRPTTHQVELLQGALDRGLPYFGICFGNQLFGRALGFGTYKLKYGHRGINQPVMDRTTGKVEVTAHNHGFAVDAPLDGADRRRRTARRRSATSASTTTSSRASSCATTTAR